jgi:hypothetical protein
MRKPLLGTARNNIDLQKHKRTTVDGIQVLFSPAAYVRNRISAMRLQRKIPVVDLDVSPDEPPALHPYMIDAKYAATSSQPQGTQIIPETHGSHEEEITVQSRRKRQPEIVRYSEITSNEPYGTKDNIRFTFRAMFLGIIAGFAGIAHLGEASGKALSNTASRLSNSLCTAARPRHIAGYSLYTGASYTLFKHLQTKAMLAVPAFAVALLMATGVLFSPFGPNDPEKPSPGLQGGDRGPDSSIVEVQNTDDNTAVNNNQPGLSENPPSQNLSSGGLTNDPATQNTTGSIQPAAGVSPTQPPPRPVGGYGGGETGGGTSSNNQTTNETRLLYPSNLGSTSPNEDCLCADILRPAESINEQVLPPTQDILENSNL